MSTVGERLREERQRLGLNQTDFGALGGVQKRAQVAYEANDRRPDSDYLSSVAARGVDVTYILTGQRAVAEGSGVGASPPVLSADEGEFARVPLHAALLAAGPGRENPNEEVVDHLAFRRDWLRRIGVSPASAVIARVDGDSMVPTIHPGDVMLIDTARAAPPGRRRSSKDVRPPPIYAILDDGLARVKRLELVADGTLALLSDNPATPVEVRPLDRVSIIGRVLWWGHTNRE